MSYGISLEPIVFEAYSVRFHPDGGGYGTDWDRSLVIEIDGELATAKLLCKKLLKSHARLLVEELRRLGVKYLEWERKGNTPRRILVEITDNSVKRVKGTVNINNKDYTIQ